MHVKAVMPISAVIREIEMEQNYFQEIFLTKFWLWWKWNFVSSSIIPHKKFILGNTKKNFVTHPYTCSQLKSFGKAGSAYYSLNSENFRKNVHMIRAKKRTI